MKKDIEQREDLVLLLNAFYAKAMHDALIGHFFTTVVQLDLATHIPVITDFWESVLLNGTRYKNNAIAIHQHLHSLSAMEEKHFSRWLAIFSETIDEHFAGDTAERAKQRALSIATVMRIKLSNISPINILNK